MITSAMLTNLDLVEGVGHEVDAVLVRVVEALDELPGLVLVAALHIATSRRAVLTAYRDEPSREAQVRSEGQRLLVDRARELFVEPPHLQRLEVLANKMPAGDPGATRSAVLVWMDGQLRRNPVLDDLVRSVRPLVEDDHGVVAWFALHDAAGAYGTASLLVDEASRETHLAGRVSEVLVHGALELVGHEPEVVRSTVLAHHMIPYRSPAGS